VQEMISFLSNCIGSVCIVSMEIVEDDGPRYDVQESCMLLGVGTMHFGWLRLVGSLKL